jgi:hypothetical protein
MRGGSSEEETEEGLGDQLSAEVLADLLDTRSQLILNQHNLLELSNEKVKQTLSFCIICSVHCAARWGADLHCYGPRIARRQLH